MAIQWDTKRLPTDLFLAFVDLLAFLTLLDLLTLLLVSLENKIFSHITSHV